MKNFKEYQVIHCLLLKLSFFFSKRNLTFKSSKVLGSIKKVLKELYDRIIRNETHERYLNNTIQNEFIELLAKEAKKEN